MIDEILEQSEMIDDGKPTGRDFDMNMLNDYL